MRDKTKITTNIFTSGGPDAMKVKCLGFEVVKMCLIEVDDCCSWHLMPEVPASTPIRRVMSFVASWLKDSHGLSGCACAHGAYRELMDWTTISSYKLNELKCKSQGCIIYSRSEHVEQLHTLQGVSERMISFYIIFAFSGRLQFHTMRVHILATDSIIFRLHQPASTILL